MSQSLKEFLDSLKPGDTFLQVRQNGFGEPSIVKIEVIRRTKTLIITRANRYYADTGRKVGDLFKGIALPPTTEQIEEIKRKMQYTHMARILKYKNWRECTYEELSEVCKVLKIDPFV